MANPGDILAPKLLADGTFEEVVLTPSSIGAALTSHKHTVADLLGIDFEAYIPATQGDGTVAWRNPSEWAAENISPIDIGAQPAGSYDSPPTYSLTPPPTPYQGQRWTDLSDLTTYEWFVNAWVEKPNNQQ